MNDADREFLTEGGGEKPENSSNFGWRWDTYCIAPSPLRFICDFIAEQEEGHEDEARKFLTEWGGECWHTPYIDAEGKCYQCGERFCENFHQQRTFDNWEDFGWLVTRLADKGLLWEFADWWVNQFPDAPTSMFSSWLARSPAARCQLICDFLREQEAGE